MSKTLPTAYTEVDGIEFKTRSPIRSSDWRALAAQQNYLYSRRGERIGGQVWDAIPWRNNTSTYAVESTSATTQKDLDEWAPVFYGRKRLSELANEAAEFTLQVYGRDYQLQVQTIDAEDGVTVLDTLTITNATSTKQWSTGTIRLKHVEAMKPDGSARLLTISVQARRNTTEAEIYQMHLRASYLAANAIPDREYMWQRYPATYTFTNAGATGHLGPSQAQVDAAYALQPQNGLVTVLAPGYQCFDVPFNGIWQVEAAGAGFNGVANQRGAVAIGNFALERGQQLRMIVGQIGENIRCGSGGTYVGLYDRAISTGNVVSVDGFRFLPLVIGGGAGGTLTSNNAAIGGQAGLTGGTSSTGALGGTGPNGGAGSGFAVAGAGWTGNGSGADGTAPLNVSQSYTNGSEGNLSPDGQSAGFGGGGTGRLTSNYRFGGGGGWGGGAAANTTSSTGYAGGGSSYINTTLGTSISITAASNIGMGYVKLTYVGQ